MVEQNPLVSIVIPYFNKETTIERSVDSVINQTHTNWEIIIVDDCSKIKFEKLAKWCNYNITVLYNDTNLGPGPSRQKALDISKGEYVAFLDADDWWAPEFLNESIGTNLQYPNHAGSWAISEIFFKEKTELRRYSQHDFENIRETILQYPRPWQTGSILWKRHFCGSWGNLSTSQDYYFELSSSQLNNKLKKIDKILYFVDQTQGNHRTDLVKQFDTNVNTYHLFLFFYNNLKQYISFKYHVILFHRIVRSLLKIEEKKSNIHDTRIYWKNFEKNYMIAYCFLRSKFLLKLVHFVLQKTSFKLHF
jgi:glycosyltransferase involved in cell wall biosynthesis